MSRTYNDMASTNSSLVKQDLDDDFTDFCTTCSEDDGPAIWDTCNWQSATELAYGVEIPINLLAGPWTDEMLKHLYWLVKSGASIDWVQSTLGEVFRHRLLLLFGQMLTLTLGRSDRSSKCNNGWRHSSCSSVTLGGNAG